MTLEQMMPTRSEYVAIVQAAAKDSGLPPQIKRKLTLYAKTTRAAVYAADRWAGECCPLLAIGVERVHTGSWDTPGAEDFMCSYDDAMAKRVGIRDKCLIGIRGDV
jgi:hypothetical protein